MFRIYATSIGPLLLALVALVFWYLVKVPNKGGQ